MNVGGLPGGCLKVIIPEDFIVSSQFFFKLRGVEVHFGHSLVGVDDGVVEHDFEQVAEPEENDADWGHFQDVFNSRRIGD